MDEKMKSEPYFNILAAAKSRHEEGNFQEAVILAQTAVEIFMERIYDRLFAKRNITDLQLPIERLLYRNYNLGHDKVVSLYEALANDEIRKAPFWPSFKMHNELRNDVVHQGRLVTKEESAKSMAVIDELIAHVIEAVGLYPH